jgi:hypothetical protein
MTKYFIATVSREHVLKGKDLGIIQVCHGNKSRLSSIKKDDFLIYYSSREFFQKEITCKKFTAICKITSEEPYQVKMTEDFHPWRKDAFYFESKDAYFYDLKDVLVFTKNKNYPLLMRYGLFEICFEDFEIIKNKMSVNI